MEVELKSKKNVKYTELTWTVNTRHICLGDWDSVWSSPQPYFAGMYHSLSPPENRVNIVEFSHSHHATEVLGNLPIGLSRRVGSLCLYFLSHVVSAQLELSQVVFASASVSVACRRRHQNKESPSSFFKKGELLVLVSRERISSCVRVFDGLRIS